MRYMVSLHNDGLHVYSDDELIDIYQLTSLNTCVLKINHFLDSDMCSMRIYDLLFMRTERGIVVYNKNTDVTTEYSASEIKNILHQLDKLITIFK